jgi:hypothetical protein
MGIFSKARVGNKATAVNGLPNAVGGVPASQSRFHGVPVLNTGSIALGTTVQTIPLPLIPGYYGLPSSRMNISVTVGDTTGGTIPTSVKGVSTAVYELAIYGRSGAMLYDGKGMDLDFVVDQHILNPYGFYTNEVVPAEGSISTLYTNVFSAVLGLSIDPAEFPLSPVVTLNTLASRAATLNGLTSNVQVQMWMDFETHQFTRAKLRSYVGNITATGQVAIQSQLDKGCTVLSHSYYFGADSALATVNTVNFANEGQQIINQTPLASLVQKENSIYPGNPHISGLIVANVIDPNAFVSDYTTVVQFNIASLPAVGGVSNICKIKLLEAY